MSTIDKAALIEQASRALIVGLSGAVHAQEIGGYAISDKAQIAMVSTVLPVVAKAVLAPLRELHPAVEVEPSDTICGECSFQLPNGRYFGKIIEHPCPTLELLDAIEAEVQP